MATEEAESQEMATEEAEPQETAMVYEAQAQNTDDTMSANT